MRKLSIIFVMMLLFSTFALATQTFKEGVTNFKVPCSFNGTYCEATTTCNLTITDPSANVIVDNRQMSYNVAYFNYSANFSGLGDYVAYLNCRNGNKDVFGPYPILITKDGGNVAGDNLTVFIYLLFIIASLGLLFTLLWNIVKIATMEATVIDVMFSWMFIVLMLITIYLGDNYLLRRFVVDMGNSLFSISIWTNGVLPIISLALSMIFKSMNNKRPPTVPEIWGEHR